MNCNEATTPIVSQAKSIIFGHVSIPGRDLPSHCGPTSAAQRLRFIGARARELFGGKLNPAMGIDFRCAMGATLSN